MPIVHFNIKDLTSELVIEPNNKKTKVTFYLNSIGSKKLSGVNIWEDKINIIYTNKKGDRFNLYPNCSLSIYSPMNGSYTFNFDKNTNKIYENNKKTLNKIKLETLLCS